MTSSTSALVSFRRVLKRAWILEKSLPCCLVRSPMTFSMSSCEVTNTHERPSHLVLSDSAIVCRLSISLVSRADELADLVDEEVEPEARVALLVEPGLDLVGEVLDRDRVRRAGTADDAVGLVSPLTSAKARSMLGPFQGALLAALGPVGMPAMRSKASLNASYWPRLSRSRSKRATWPWLP